MSICLICKKPLKAFGESRKNGKPHPDWIGRKYHKQCWKKEMQYRSFIEFTSCGPCFIPPIPE
jgi:hypothetical protein